MKPFALRLTFRHIKLYLPWIFGAFLFFSISGCQPAKDLSTTVPSLNPLPGSSQTPGITPIPFSTSIPVFPTSPQIDLATPVSPVISETASETVVRTWQLYADGKYGFSFLYPKNWQIKELDAHHLQLIDKDTALTIGYRFLDEKVSLAPAVNKSDLSQGSGFDFMGERITVQNIIQAVPNTGNQTVWKAFYYDGGGELVRGRLVFSLRLQNIQGAKSLEKLLPTDLHLFSFVVGSFQADPQKITDPAGAKVNLAKLGLGQTESIEIGLFNPQIAVSRYLYQHLINDPELIAKIVNLLDREVPIEPGSPCIEAYELTFHLTRGQQMTFGYSCNHESGGLNRGAAKDGSVNLGGVVAVRPEFNQIIQPEIAKAELLRENNAPPLWKSRIVKNTEQAGPFTLEEYTILDPGRWAPYSLEFKAIIPDEVFAGRANIRHSDRMLPGDWMVQMDGHEIRVLGTWDANLAKSVAVVQKDGKEVFRIPTRGAAGLSPIRGLWAWNGQWVLEVEGHIVIDGQELNQKLGAQETFDWQIMDSKPFAFFLKNNQLNIWYDGKTYTLDYDRIVHNTCCEAGMFDVGHNAIMVWFYAHRDSLWRYVEMGLY